MKKFLTQPLIHFLVLGAVLFVIYDTRSGNNEISPDEKTILVDRNELLTYMQYSAMAFNDEHFSQQLDNMGTEERQQLIDALVREEVLFREAKMLQLDSNDYVIKRRLIQKLEFLTKGFISAGSGLTGSDIESYYEQNKNEYYEQPYVTFTHVFFDFERHDIESAGKLALETLDKLNNDRVAFSEGIQYGDRFLYHTNYVERTADYVASHFGISMADSLFGLAPDDGKWRGPFESPYGMHLVMLTDKQPGRFPDVAEIYDRVRDDAEQAIVRERTEQAIDELVKSYDVKVVLD